MYKLWWTKWHWEKNFFQAVVEGEGFKPNKNTYSCRTGSARFSAPNVFKFSNQRGRSPGKIASYLATFDKKSVLDLRFSPWQMKIRSSGMLLSSSSLSSSLLTSNGFILGCSVLQCKTGQYNTVQDNILQYDTITHITQYNTLNTKLHITLKETLNM